MQYMKTVNMHIRSMDIFCSLQER